MMSAITVSAQNVPAIWEAPRYQPPAGLEAPGNLSQGGTRSGSNVLAQKSLLPLVPQDNHFGVTTEAYPSILVYVGDNFERSDVNTLEFLLLDEGGEEVYCARFSVELQEQVLRIDLPEYAGLAPLVEGKDYLWLLEGFTEDFSLSETLFAHGWIRRVAPSASLTSELASVKSSEDTINAYINDGVWYDAIAKLEEGFVGGTAADNIVEKWDALLQSAGVQDVAVRNASIGQ